MVASPDPARASDTNVCSHTTTRSANSSDGGSGLAPEVLGEELGPGFVGVAAPAHEPVAEDHRFVGEAQRALHELLDEQHGDALVTCLPERLEHEVDHQRREP